ncbi:retrovirus-related Pol polyprotein from transposon opus [Trichonephila clavipes]|nr:retrovirus-related Pol polyprotein from transposon opus [Trichonephila clavipes]
MITHTHTDQLKRRVPADVREQFVDNWVKSIVTGDLADKLDEYESVRANDIWLENALNTRKTPPRNARSNIITAKGTELEFTKEVVTARVSIPISVPINTKNGIDDLQLVDIKCGHTSIKAVIDTGAQISVLREDLIGKGCGEGEGTIQIFSAFGEKEIAALKLFNFKIDDGKHGTVPIMGTVPKKLINDIYFESPKDKDIEFRKEIEELRKETENEIRIRETMHKEEVEARLKVEEESKAVEKRRRMEEERTKEYL